MNYYCYFNGKILKKADIQVGIYDLVMIRGYGVFDFFRTYHGTAFRLPDYLDRFVKSARKMQLKLPVNRKEIAGIVELLLQKNKASDKRDFGIRFLLTGGYSLDAYLPAVTPNLFVLIEDLPHYPSWWSEKGIKLMLHEHKRELSVVKTT
jgi:branched-chain amino acid aminotransferase